MKKEFAIGETFQFGLIKLRVEKADINSTFPCDDCFFNKRECNKLMDAIGNCNWADNEEKVNKVFVKVEE